jgi:hypothetical protein
MPSRPLWQIPDPVNLLRQAAARWEVAEAQRRDREARAADRKNRKRREAIRAMQAETERRAEERRLWNQTHTAPTREELAALLEDGPFPSLRERLKK